MIPLGDRPITTRHSCTSEFSIESGATCGVGLWVTTVEMNSGDCWLAHFNLRNMRTSGIRAPQAMLQNLVVRKNSWCEKV